MKARTHSVGLMLLLAPCYLAFACPRADAADKTNEKQLAQGRELFMREWLPDDKRSHAGDGLGPLFNGNSCMECHHQGGAGGSGPNGANVTLLSAFVERQEEVESVGLLARLLGMRPKPKPKKEPPPQLDRAKLAELHPGFRTSNSVPFHRFATGDEYAKWRKKFFVDSLPGLGEKVGIEEKGDIEEFRLSGLFDSGSIQARKAIGDVSVQFIGSQRNTPALFGTGLIDSIPERVLEEVAAEQAKRAANQPADSANSKVRQKMLKMGLGTSDPLPEKGRVSKLKDGRVGRFGWKGHVASLKDFTLQACAIELGLEVPGVPQSPLPWKPGYKAPGLDLTAQQCDALIAFVAALPRPKERKPETDRHEAEIVHGRKLFGQVGCAACHRPKLGDVEGIYSDLLLHDMGDELSDFGSYGTPILADSGDGKVDPIPELKLDGSEPDRKKEKPPKFGAAPREWRTPPLWGFRDSGPYLHDGRANTLTEAVARHGGEGQESSLRFLELSGQERRQVELFLKSLTAP